LDPIIGIWQLTSETENGNEITTDCEKKTTITFLENGTTSEIYYYDSGNNTCEADTDVENSTWENVGNSNYRISYGDIDDSETVKLLFSDNNTVFTYTDVDEYNGTTNTYVTTYRKQ
jgi:hypothetical protein